MNTWNSEYVQKSYPRQVAGFITKVNGSIKLQHPVIGTLIRKLVAEGGGNADSEDTISKAREMFFSNATSRLAPMAPYFGYVVKWLSELGKAEELDALLKHANRHLNPTWERGGLFYPRQDEVLDENGEWKFVGTCVPIFGSLLHQNKQ